MRFSKQREAVYNVLCQTTSHPDVAWIYARTREIIPNISIATVYRNLQELLSIGKIKKLSAEGYAERYDANVSDHAHLVCSCCGKIVDIDMSQVDVKHSITGVDRYEITFYGCCDECRNNKDASQNKQ